MRGAERAREVEGDDGKSWMSWKGWNVRGRERGRERKEEGRRKAENRRTGKRGAPRATGRNEAIQGEWAGLAPGSAPGSSSIRLAPPRAAVGVTSWRAPAVWLPFRVLGQSRPWKADGDLPGPRPNMGVCGGGKKKPTSAQRQARGAGFRRRLESVCRPHICLGPRPALGLRMQGGGKKGRATTRRKRLVSRPGVA